MAIKRSMKYQDTGVLDNTELGLRALLQWVNRTEEFRSKGAIGSKAIDIGFFAAVINIGNGLGLTLCTDGVGTKILVAEMLDRYDTIGIDCVAMNVNDAICVGAEPIAFLDYIAIESATPRILEEIGRGLYEGARLANVNIVGGEISQIAEIIKGYKPGSGLDLVGMCAGIVPLDKIIDGRNVEPGDVIIGIRSSGVHCNGLTLARKALFEEGKLAPGTRVAELGNTIGEELLKPTHIYVAPVRSLLRKGLPVRALVNITGDGFLNLARVAAKVGFRIDKLPEPQPIFGLIQRSGNISDAEMYRVFNMGVGFCVIVPNDASAIDGVRSSATETGFVADVIGEVIQDETGSVLLPEKNLIGQGETFRAV